VRRWPDLRASASTGRPDSHGDPAHEGLARFRVVLSAVTGLGAVVVVGGWLGVGLGAAVAAVLWRVLSRLETPATRRRREELVAGLPHAVDLMAATLSVGASPSAALGLVAHAVDAPMSSELLLVAGRLELGMDPVHVWTDLGAHPQLGPLGRALARAVDSGAPVSEAMIRLSEDLRRSSRAAVESRARSVGVKAAAPLGLCLLPAFVLVGIVPLVVAAAQSVVWL
jgi:Flp pilus assembly protein TadB